MAPAPTLTQRLRGLVALLGLIILMLGIPTGLYIAGGSPFPASLPTGGDVVGALTSPDDGTLILQILKYVGWIAWASFAAMVITELVSRLRGVRAPRIPALGWQQRAAAGLVGAAALLFTTVGPLMPAPSAHADTGASPQASSQTETGGQASQQAGEATQDQQGTSQQGHRSGGPTYTVQEGDSLYEIAERHLGDGARFKEIAKLNYGTPQPDGRTLGQDHWLEPGWKLVMPEDANLTTGQPGPQGGEVTVDPGDTLSGIAQETTGDANQWPELFEANKGEEQPDGGQLVDPDLIQPGWTITVPGTNTPAPETEPSKSTTPEAGDPGGTGPEATQQQAAPDSGQQDRAPQAPEKGSAGEETAQTERTERTEQAPAPVAEGSAQADTDSAEADEAEETAEAEDGFPVRTVAGAGALLAATVLGLLAVRRARQQRRRRPGQPMPMPTGETLEVEEELRTVADPVSVELVDLALRHLAAQCGTLQQPLPKIRAARLTAEQFDLYLAEPAVLPEPWKSAGGQSGERAGEQVVWSITRDAENLLHGAETAAELREQPAPYPALVTLGQDEEGGHVLVDLEYLGALGITGADTAHPETTRYVMAALAIELATSHWADDLQITIVGAYSELEDGLETGRVRYMPAIGRLLDELQHRATQDRQALINSGAGDLSHARVTGDVPGTWTPEIVLLTGETSAEQRSKLETLVAELPRVALAAVTHGESVGEWNIRLTGPQTGVLEPYGLGLQPQLLDDATYAQILQALDVADTDQTEPDPTWASHTEPTLADVDHVMATLDEGEDETSHPVSTDTEPTPVGGVEVPAARADSDQTDQVQEADDVQDVKGEVGADSEAEASAPEHTADENTVEVTDEHPAPGESTTYAALQEALAEEEETEAEQTEAPAVQTDVNDPAAADQETYSVDQPDAAGVEAAATTTAATDLDEDQSPTEADELDETAPNIENPADEETDEPENEQAAEVMVMPKRGPRILLLGDVTVEGAVDSLVEPTRRKRLTELAAIIVTHPGCDHTTIDECYYPSQRVRDNTRNTQMSKLRKWFGKTTDGDDFLPRYSQGARYSFHEDVTSDWDQWHELLPDGPADAPTENLEAALRLVRGQPFAGVPARRYAWAESLKQTMIATILDAAYELARRQLMAGRWMAVEATTTLGLQVEPGVEALWRMRLNALRARNNPQKLERVMQDLTNLAEEWGGELEDETEELLQELRNGPTPARADIAAGAR